MNKIFSTGMALASIMCVLLFGGISGISKTPSEMNSGSYGSDTKDARCEIIMHDNSSENGIPSFLASKVKKNSSSGEQIGEGIVLKEKKIETFSTETEICENDLGDAFSTSEDLVCFKQEGFASWYGENLHGKVTASGELFDMTDLTAAHLELPFGTLVEVFNISTNLSIKVRINDRGPFVPGRIINLSHSAAKKIDLLEAGVSEVMIRTVDTE